MVHTVGDPYNYKINTRVKMTYDTSSFTWDGFLRTSTYQVISTQY